MDTDEFGPDPRDVHWMLLRLAGQLPDDLMTECRYWLSEGRRAEIARAVTHAVLSHRRPVSAADVALLGDLLVEGGADSSALSMVEVDDVEPMPVYGFAPGRAARDRMLAGQGAWEEPSPADQSQAAQPEDAADLALIRALDPAQVRAAWRAWRFPADGAPWPAPRRVYVVETAPGADLPRVAVTLASALAAADEAAPQVEVYPQREELPTYQRMARAYGGLIWAAEPDPGVRIATLFDGVDAQTGPTMHPDHPVAPADEREHLLNYLRRGEPLLVTTARMDDVVDPSRLATVPMNFLTDGHWVWTDATTYYLEQYGLLPDSDLVAHIRNRQFTFTEVDGAGVHRALAVLQEPVTEEPAWTYG